MNEFHSTHVICRNKKENIPNTKPWAEKCHLFKVYEIIEKLHQRYKFKKSLDLGCADGSFSDTLRKEFGFDAYGIDISANAVKLANQKGVVATVHNLEEKFPFEDDSFDLVIACEVIEHIYDTDHFLEESNRVLERNGFLVISTPNLTSLFNRAKMLLGRYPFGPEYRDGHGRAGHIRAYTLPTLSKQIESHGFQIVLKTSPNFTFPMVNPHIPYFLKRMAMRLGDFFPALGTHIIVVCKK